MTTRLYLVDGREYDVRADLVQLVALFDRERLAFVHGKLLLSVDEITQVRERSERRATRAPDGWHRVHHCFLAPRPTRNRAHWRQAPPASDHQPDENDTEQLPSRQRLSKMAARLLPYVQGTAGATAQQCADAMGCHRYSAQRALSELRRAGLLVSRRVPNPHGGFGIIDLWFGDDA
jgi:hypothetical protein